jgi:predicted permease
MSWLGRLLRRNRMEQQLDMELRFHLDQHAADLTARGMDPAAARRQARLAIGGPEQVKEGCRDARGTRWLEDLWQDTRYAVRTLRQKPGFTAVTLATLALGIGATTLMFTVIDGVLLRPLPYADPGRLLAMHSHEDSWNVAAFGERHLSQPDFRDCQKQVRSADIAGWVYNNATLSEPGQAEYVRVKEISANLISVLGVPVQMGRAFLPEEDRAGGVPVAILSYGQWQQRFAASPVALGSSLVADGVRYTIVGVMRPDFRLNDEEGDVYLPMGRDTARYMTIRRATPVTTVARLRPGATLVQTQTELALIGKGLAAQYPDTNKNRSLVAAPLRPDVSDVQSTLWLLLGAVSLVLLIACANVASLLLARAVSRERELAMRVALGAGRFRLVRQCLTEGAVLGLGGGLLGVALAVFGARPFASLWPGELPRAEGVQTNWQVLLFALGVSLACGLLFGLAPALRVPARVLERALRSGTRGAGGSQRLHGGFVTAEIALAMVLLLSAGMLGRTMIRLATLDPGIDVHNVLVARMALSPAVLQAKEKIRAQWDDILVRVRRQPGVDAATAVDTVPLRSGNNQNGWSTTPVTGDDKLPLALSTSVMPDYLKVMGIRLIKGRFFDDRDRIGSTPVIVIDEVMAHIAFPGQDAIGKRLWVPDMTGLGTNDSKPEIAPLLVVGIASHVRYWGLAGDDQAQVRAQFYYPFLQVPDGWLPRWSQLMSIVVRTTVPPLSLVLPLRSELKGTANDQVLYQVRTLELLERESIALQRFLLLLFAIFAGLSMVLACIGIYGVLAYLTGQRVPEFGVRMALGATAGEVMRLVMRQSLRMIVAGTAIGVAGALAAGRLLQKLVAGMQPSSLETFALMIAILMAAALFASFLPARRVSRVDPVSALRQE